MRTYLALLLLSGLCLTVVGCGGTTVCTDRTYRSACYTPADDYVGFAPVTYVKEPAPVAEAKELPPAPTPDLFDDDFDADVEAAATVESFSAPPVAPAPATCDPCAGL